jgi:hypothetical protein
MGSSANVQHARRSNFRSCQAPDRWDPMYCRTLVTLARGGRASVPKLCFSQMMVVACIFIHCLEVRSRLESRRAASLNVELVLSTKDAGSACPK